MHLSLVSRCSFFRGTLHYEYILSKRVDTFTHIHRLNNDSSEGGMESFFTIIIPGKEYWPNQGSNYRPPNLRSRALPIEQHGLGDSPCDKIHSSLKANVCFCESYVGKVAGGFEKGIVLSICERNPRNA